MAKTERPKTERQLWRMVHGSTQIAEVRRRHADVAFKKLFPDGHQTSLRFYIEPFAASKFVPEGEDDLFRSFAQIHPEAFQVLLDYGRDYIPVPLGEELASEREQPIPGKCFANARIVLEGAKHHWGEMGKRIQYVEGIAAGALVRPMLHGWNAIASHPGFALDWSHYAVSAWSRYFGIPFTRLQHNYIMERAYGERNTRSLFDKDNFEGHREPLMRILSKRAKRKTAP